MKEMKNGVFTYKDESYNFDFKTSLSAYDRQVFVRTVVDNLISDDSYDVVIKDLVFDFVIVEMFTNVDTSFINMKDEDGEDISQIILIEHFLKESDIVDIVKANMDNGVLDELNRAIDLNIQYRTGIQSNSFGEAVASLIATLEKKINEFDLGDMVGLAKKFANTTEDFNLDNLVNAYMNSDIHKDNLKAIAEVKEESKNK